MPASAPRLALVLLAATAAAACHPKPIGRISRDGAMRISTEEPTKGPLTVARRLNCPEATADWTRESAAADGTSCSYTGPRGRLDLALTAVSGDDAAAALAPNRAALDALIPSAQNAMLKVDTAKGPDGREKANVDMPFLHVHDDGRHATVRMLGINIDGPSHHMQGGSARVSTDTSNGVHVNVAGGDKDDDDDKPAVAGAGAEMVYLLAGKPAGDSRYHAVGYIARADRAGRAVVATFKYYKGSHSEDDTHDDPGVKALLDLNTSRQAPAATDQP